MGRSPCCDENGLKKGPWTPEEDQKLIQCIQKHGHGSWRALPKLAGDNSFLPSFLLVCLQVSSLARLGAAGSPVVLALSVSALRSPQDSSEIVVNPPTDTSSLCLEMLPLLRKMNSLLLKLD
ncbi:hypothetical protein ZIOFF_020416 [Zingiber officinale]|uniref:Uncharacterized protein n=1 Tax=Zingiber officinale TaxID=94328 RepID=A0A8J5LLA9_ZINOF|nr:hypothetical protein ZIOFF_020416 [Zingiber officinale]